MTDLVIVGAGVLGLSTAWALKDLTNLSITVVAEYGPHVAGMNASMTDTSKYTSAWAGAHFRPAPSHNEAEYEMALMTRTTQAKFLALAKTNPESSIKFLRGVEYFEAPDAQTATFGRGYCEDIQDFKLVPRHQLPDGVKLGTSYTTWVLNPPVFLKYVYQELVKKNVAFVHKKIHSLRQINDIVGGNPIIVNCSGTGLLYDGRFDPACFPIRGQTLLVSPPPDCRYVEETVTHQSKDGLWTFNVPRPLNGGVVLGGTKQVNDTYDGVRDEDTEAIIARGSILFPELMKTNEHGEKYFDIVGVNVGFRPARTGGLRVEFEPKSATQSNNVIHNYGAGHMGYELSYGSGVRVYEKLKQHGLLQSKLNHKL